MHLFLTALLLAAPATPESITSEPTLGGHPQTARSIGMGGAMRGIAEGIDAVYVNPAGIARNKRYLIEGGYTYGQDAVSHKVLAGVVDSQTTAVAAGLTYSYEHRDKSGSLAAHRINFALAYSFSIFSVGLSAKWTHAERSDWPVARTRTTYDDGSTVYVAPLEWNPQPSKLYSKFTGDAALMLNPIPQVSLGVIGYNLIPGGTEAFEYAPLALGATIAAHIMGLELGADVVIDFQSSRNLDPNTLIDSTGMLIHQSADAITQPRLHFGAEYSIVGIVPLRAGFIYDKVGGDMFWSCGAGYQHQVFGVDVGYRQGIAVTNNRYISATIQVKLQ